jgi:hypothetical protein
VHDQLNLLPGDSFKHPLKWREMHYVPLLKSMPGELTALKSASSATWDRMTPLVEATGRAGVDELPASSTFPNLARRLGPAITAGRPFFLDFPWLDSRAKVHVRVRDSKKAVNVIEHVFEGCRSSGLTFIPVLAPGHDALRASLVKAAIERDGHGICLRVPITGVVWEKSVASSIEKLLAKVGTGPHEIDLLLDLSHVSSPPGFSARHVKTLIESIPNLREWRSLILAGTVIPSTAAGWEEGGITELTRHEWLLYRELLGLAPERMPTFGDYAIQHPEPPEAGGPGMRGSIRYTTEQVVLFARGYSIVEHGSDQYRELCQMLVNRPEFCGADYSWGDQIIGATAASSTRPSGEPLWRGAGTSHHLRFMAESVARP